MPRWMFAFVVVVVVVDSLDHDLRLLRGRRVVQVDQRLAAHLLGQDGEIAPQRRGVERGGPVGWRRRRRGSRCSCPKYRTTPGFGPARLSSRRPAPAGWPASVRGRPVRTSKWELWRGTTDRARRRVEIALRQVGLVMRAQVVHGEDLAVDVVEAHRLAVDLHRPLGCPRETPRSDRRPRSRPLRPAGGGLIALDSRRVPVTARRRRDQDLAQHVAHAVVGHAVQHRLEIALHDQLSRLRLG